VTLVVMGVVRVLLVAVVFIGFIGCEFFHRCFFGELCAVQGVGVSDVSLMGRCHSVIFLISFSGKPVVFGCQLKVMSGFQMGVVGFFVKFVVVFGCGHFRVVFGWLLFQLRLRALAESKTPADIPDHGSRSSRMNGVFKMIT
jgi:hypothetical protein